MKEAIFQSGSYRQKHGFVLILVLCILVLITIVVIGFLGHATSQSKSMASYRDQTGNMVLSDVAVNIVKAQIDDATGAGATTSGSTPGLWASQPGAIRTISSSGSTQTTYKLYSSNVLIDTAAGTALGTDIAADLPTGSAAANNDWASSPVWTDLNAPTLKSDGTFAYPIIDVVNDSADLPSGTTAPAPFATGNFNIVSGNTVGAVRSAANNYPLPMPVRWLYVLKQGQIIAPDATSTATQVTFTNTPAGNAPTIPTAANPIVGRIAFWTDDNTCRVNINTASVNVNTGTTGTFWDTPHFTASDDYQLALKQPVNKEFQRYAGHPATTTLSLALPEWAPGGTVTTGTASTAEALIALTPRYGTGGSLEGTASASASIVSSTNRLYASVDELLFDPTRTPTKTPAGANLSKSQVETAKFFLTAHSRAPELNLFGTPRVAIWPISSNNDSNHRTASDQLIAFCSTTPGATPYSYFFIRDPYTVAGAAPATGSNSPTSDVNLPRNVSLLSYLDTLTAKSLPGNLGAGATFDSKYTQLGKRQILTEIFDYVRITNARDPGLDPAVSGSPAGGVPYAAPTSWDDNFNGNAGYGQIVPTQYATWGTYGFGRYQGRIIEASIVFGGVGRGIPAGTTTYLPQPSPPWVAVTTQQAGMWSPGWTGVSPMPAGTLTTLIPHPGMTAVDAFLVLTFFDPAFGYSRYESYIDLQTSGLNSAGFQANGPHLFKGDMGERLGNLVAAIGVYSTYQGANPGSLGGLMDFRMMVGGREGGQGLGDNQYEGMGNIVELPTSGTFAFTGGPLTVYTYGPGAPIPAAGATTANIPLVHQFNLQFPSANLPVPALSNRPIFGTQNNRPSGYVARIYPNTPPTTTTATNDRFDDIRSTSQVSGQYDCHLIDFANDTVISVVPNAAAGYGDYRMLCAPVTTLGTVPNYTYTGLYSGLTQAQRLGYGFRYPTGQVFPSAVYGNLVNNVPSSSYTQQGVTAAGVGTPAYGSIPFVPSGVSYPTAGHDPGVSGGPPPDFDNGFGELPDGPYINKPDEGAVYPAASSNRVYYDNGGSVIDVTQSPAFFFSPQRQVPSPVMFGSLPTGAPVGATASSPPTIGPSPWQTLLFQPGAAGHMGLASPKDEYLLDFFWMPQSEPYAISEPFSTAGKVNLNYQIFPFTYIDRSTAIQSVLSSEKVAKVGVAQAGTYKQDLGNTTGGMGATAARQTLNLSEVDGTLRQFVQKFNNFDFFKAAAEICDVYLVPSSESWTSDSVAQSTWYDTSSSSKYSLVGDNAREKPYADIYSRITTKSNSFTVYYRVQTLKNPSSAGPAQWTEGQGSILGDYRGSTTLERYIDPNDTTVPDYATAAAGTTNLETHYKWRVIENTRFAP